NGTTPGRRRVASHATWQTNARPDSASCPPATRCHHSLTSGCSARTSSSVSPSRTVNTARPSTISSPYPLPSSAYLVRTPWRDDRGVVDHTHATKVTPAAGCGATRPSTRTYEPGVVGCVVAGYVPLHAAATSSSA